MRKILTLKFSVMILMLAMSVGYASAQSFYIEVTAPAEIAGTRIGFQSAGTVNPCTLPFDKDFTTKWANPELAGDVDNINDNQFEFVESLEGYVGVAKRGGGIGFDVKIANIEFNGGIGSIIVNNDAANPDATIGMSTTSGAFNSWALMVSYNVGLMLEQYPEVTFQFKIDIPADNDVIVWADNGFSGGLGDWTAVGLQCGNGGQPAEGALWQWSAAGSTQGLYGGNTITSATVCNGAAFFNSDLYDTNLQALGAGPCTANQIGELISPNIDLSDVPAGTTLVLRFNQATRQYQSGYFVSWSNDGGNTWNDIEINTDLVVNSAHINNVQRIRLAGAEPSANFRVKFRYEANFYYWIIDDIKIVQPEDYNIKIDKNWTTSAVYPTNPLSQITKNYVMTDIENKGGKAATNVKLNVKITNSSNTVVEEFNENLGTLNPGDTIQNRVYGSYLTPTTPGEYTIKYEVSMDSTDFDNSDNSYTSKFVVSDNKWSRDIGFTRNVGIAPNGNTIDWAYSAIFRGEDESANDKNRIKNFNFGVGNANELAAVGANIMALIIEGEDLNQDGQLTIGDEYEIVGYSEYLFETGSAGNTLLSLPITDIETLEEKEVEIKPGKLYIASLVYQNLPGVTTNCYWLASDNYNHDASEWIALEEDGIVRPSAELHTNFSFDGAINIGYSSRQHYFSGKVIPHIVLDLVNPSSTKNAPLADNTFSVFPTNTSSDLNVAFNFINSTDATIEIVDNAGKVVLMNKLQGQKDQVNSVNVGQFAQGTYFVKVTTPQGTLSKPFNVIK